MRTTREGFTDASRAGTRGDDGTSMIEFVIVLTLVFLPLIWGLITFGYAFSVRENLTHSAQEALRQAVVAAQAAGVPNGQKSSDGTATTGIECLAISNARSRMSGIIGRHNQASSSTTATDTRCSSPVSAADGGLDISTNYVPPTTALNPDGTTADGTFPACKDNGSPPADIANSSCVTVTLIYKYGRFPIISPLPGIFDLVPSTIKATATERIR